MIDGVRIFQGGEIFPGGVLIVSGGVEICFRKYLRFFWEGFGFFP